MFFLKNRLKSVVEKRASQTRFLKKRKIEYISGSTV